MGKKGIRKFAYVGLLLALTQNIAAQISDGMVGVSDGGLIDIYSNLIGIQVNDPTELITVTAAIGVFWMGMYFILKVGVNQYKPLREALLPSDGVNGGGRNLVAIMSGLLVLTAIGANNFMNLVTSLQAFVVTIIATGILGGIIYFFFGAAKFGGAGLTAIGAGAKSVSASAKQTEADAEDKLAQAKQKLDEVREEHGQVPSRKEVQDMEAAIQLLAQAEKDLDQVLEKDIQELEDAVRTAEKIYGSEERELELDKEIEQLFEDLQGKVSNIVQRNYSSPAELESWVNEIETETKELKNEIQGLEQMHSAEQNVDAELQEILDAAQEVHEGYKILKTMKQELDQGEAEFEQLAQELSQRDELGVEQGQIKKLESRLNNLQSLESKAVQELERAEEVLKNQVALEEEEIEIMKHWLDADSSGEVRLERMLRTAQSRASQESSSAAGVLLNLHSNVLPEIRNEIKRLAEFDESVETKEQQALRQIEQALQDIRNT